MSALFDVLADQTRRDLLELLLAKSSHGEPEVSVSELVDALDVSQPTVSKHLKVLREAGLVSVRLDGQRRLYSLNSAPLVAVGEWLAKFNIAVGSTVSEVVETTTHDVLPAIGEGVTNLAHTVGELGAEVSSKVRQVGETTAERSQSLFDTGTVNAKKLSSALNKNVIEPIKRATRKDA